jgi:hypothetical protein
MKTHDRQSLDDQQLEGSKKSAKPVGARPANLEGSIRDLQATAGNRAVSDLVAGTRPTVQGSFFGNAFGGAEDWLAKESPGATPGFDASTKEEPRDASMKVADASDKWDASQKFDASDKWDASQKFDASDKWDASQKFDASEKWDASGKSEPDLASKSEELGSDVTEFEEF